MMINSLQAGKGKNEYSVFNLGTGIGYSVLDMVQAMKDASGRLVECTEQYEYSSR